MLPNAEDHYAFFLEANLGEKVFLLISFILVFQKAVFVFGRCRIFGSHAKSIRTSFVRA